MAESVCLFVFNAYLLDNNQNFVFILFNIVMFRSFYFFKKHRSFFILSFSVTGGISAWTMNLTSAVLFLCLVALTSHALPMDESRDEYLEEFTRRGNSPLVYQNSLFQSNCQSRAIYVRNRNI